VTEGGQTREGGADGLYAARIGLYRREVLRWNRQINLVTRLRTEAQLATLISQSEAAFRLLVHALEDLDRAFGAHGGGDAGGPRVRLQPLLHVDIGSGGGLPACVWRAGWEREAAGRPAHAPPAALWIEPRRKRAWFLERIARLCGWEGVRVIEGRWGEDARKAPAPSADPGGSTAPAWIVSLQALRLTDREVRGGLRAILGDAAPPRPQGDLLVARILPDTAALDPPTIARFGLPPGAGGDPAGEGRVALLGSPGPESTGIRLLLSHYRFP
jgi:hypothetical protein